MQAKAVEPESLERLVPDQLLDAEVTGRETLELHLERYKLASRHARGRVLDIACGVGYGTRHLADHGNGVTEAVGVDVADDAVAYAASRYGRAGVRFQRADAQQFYDAQGFDTIVSLETIEHVPAPETLLVRLISSLRPGGILITSVPTTPSVDVNPHHLHDFTASSFRAMVRRFGLREIDHLMQVQRYKLFSVLSRSETRMSTMREGLAGYYLRHPNALLRRLTATARYGFTNRYLTVAWQR